MNEKLKELAEQAELITCIEGKWYPLRHEITQLVRFAKLVDAAAVAREREQCAKDYLEDCVRSVEKEREESAKHYLRIMRDAVEQAILKEREACAKLCDDWRGHVAANLAAVIRGRTEPKSEFKNQMDDNWAGLI